jgi:hypothetical protein
MPLRVKASIFFEKGASIMIGSRKYPIEREVGHSCVTGPPEMIPGLRRIAVPNIVRSTPNKRIKNIPVRDISIMVPLVTFSISLNKLTS